MAYLLINMFRKLTRFFIVAAIVPFATAVLYAQKDPGSRTTAPVFTGLIRTVKGNQLNSMKDPAVTLKFDDSYRYIGGQKFLLYGVANAEQHFFVNAGSDKRMNSMYWVQFEEYLPDNNHTYDYSDSQEQIKINDIDFYLDTQPVHPDPAKSRPGSDSELVKQFLQSKGYTYPSDMNFARLVHLTDASKRKELMIIFIDDLAPLGLTADDLMSGGKAATSWPEIKTSHINKMRSGLTLIQK